MKELCAICGEPADDPHHVTGRGADGAYLDPEFRAPVCHSHHEFVGEDLWTIEGTSAGDQTEPFLESLELRLSRTASFVGRVAENLPEPLAAFLAGLAKHLAVWAAELADYIACS